VTRRPATVHRQAPFLAYPAAQSVVLTQRRCAGRDRHYRRLHGRCEPHE
jgi:hypothetical protein